MPVRGDVDMASADPCMQKALKAVEDPDKIATGVQRFITEDTSNELNSLITQYWADDSMTADQAQAKLVEILKNSSLIPRSGRRRGEYGAALLFASAAQPRRFEDIGPAGEILDNA